MQIAIAKRPFLHRIASASSGTVSTGGRFTFVDRSCGQRIHPGNGPIGGRNSFGRSFAAPVASRSPAWQIAARTRRLRFELRPDEGSAVDAWGAGARAETLRRHPGRRTRRRRGNALRTLRLSARPSGHRSRAAPVLHACGLARSSARSRSRPKKTDVAHQPQPSEAGDAEEEDRGRTDDHQPRTIFWLTTLE